MRTIIEPRQPDPKASLGKRLLWFVGIYAASVVVFAIVAFLLQSLLPH